MTEEHGVHSEKMINLWTLHTPDFSLIDGSVDHSRSKYWNDTEGVKEAYPELWIRLCARIAQTEKAEVARDGQIIWCFTNESEIKKTCDQQVLWQLRLPLTKVLAYVDDLVWNRILGIRCDVGVRFRNRWKNEGIRLNPHNPEKAKAYEKRCQQKFWDALPQSGSWWDELFAENQSECSKSALICHPVPESWVVSKTPW